ncbi:serine/threonine-protein kinase [Streptomyces sp. 184]|uniref:serine/threonine-protein kinase n=1 Tax=Streptomyces sp. 184 TaxID=1827526 RepID=UPI0038918D2B
MESVEPLAPQDPQQIGAYRLLGRLGSGGMGRVYLGRTAGGRTVAVKLVKPELAVEEEFRARFRTEVRAAARVGGRWTAPVLDADTEAPVPWVATGYVAGPTLQEVVERYGPLPPESLFTLAYGLASALRDVHAAGLVHRDLKPSNVLVTIEGPRVIDFGIARALDSLSDGTVTRTGIVVGSPSFMSPEQIIGEDVSAASDVFCVGGLLAYAATGRAPFGSSSSGMHAVMFRVVQEEPDLAGVTDPALHGLISGCLAKLPAERHDPDRIAGLAGPPAPEAAWLPAPLIADLGRQAVRLLDTDTPPAGDRDTSPLRTVPPADPTPTPTPTPTATRTPTPTPTPHRPATGAEPRVLDIAATNGSGHRTATAAGAGSEAVTARHSARPPAAERDPAATGDDSDPRLPATRTRPYEAPPASYAPATEPPAGSAPAPPRRRPRRARLLAGLALLVAIGVAVPVALATQRDGGGTAAPGSDVPTRFVGTWLGTQTRDGEPTGTYRQFTIRPGQKGEVVATSIVLSGESQCTSEARLRSADRGLRLDTEVVEAAPAGECTAVGGHTLTYADGALRWRAADGRTAELTKVESRDRRMPRELLGSWQRPAGSGTQVMRVVQAAPGQVAVHFTTRTGDGNTCRARADFVGVDERDDRVLLGPSEITSVSGPESEGDPAADDLGDDSAAGAGRLGGPCVPGFPSAMQATADGSVLDRQFLGGEQRTRHYTRADGSPADPTQ